MRRLKKRRKTSEKSPSRRQIPAFPTGTDAVEPGKAGSCRCKEKKSKNRSLRMKKKQKRLKRKKKRLKRTREKNQLGKLLTNSVQRMKKEKNTTTRMT
jgi:hypothetical protein